MMLALGFSSGLPFLLVGNTFGYWLRDEGTSLAAIGFLSWVGIAYSLKFLWAPMIDRVMRRSSDAGPPARLDGCCRRSSSALACSPWPCWGPGMVCSHSARLRWWPRSPLRRRTS